MRQYLQLRLLLFVVVSPPEIVPVLLFHFSIEYACNRVRLIFPFLECSSAQGLPNSQTFKLNKNPIGGSTGWHKLTGYFIYNKENDGIQQRIFICCSIQNSRSTVTYACPVLVREPNILV